MRLETAIKFLDQQIPYYKQAHQADIVSALILGIEAMKAVKASRRLWGSRGVGTLPIETDD